MKDAVFSISAESLTHARARVSIRTFEVVVDEPESLGGTDTAPNPVEYLLASYAGCLNVLCFMVADEMGFALRGVRFEMEGSLNPDRLYARSFAQRAGFKEIKARIIPDTDADGDTLQKWLSAIKERCPVGDNIGNATPIALTVG